MGKILRHQGILTIQFPYDEQLMEKYFRKYLNLLPVEVAFKPCVKHGDSVEEGSPLGYFVGGTLDRSNSDYELPSVRAPTAGKVVLLDKSGKTLSAWDELIALDVGQPIQSKVTEEILARKATADLYLHCQKERITSMRPMHWQANPFGTTFAIVYGVWYFLVGKFFDKATKFVTDSKDYKWP